MANGRVKLGRGQTSQCEAKYCLPFTASPIASPQESHHLKNRITSRIASPQESHHLKNRITSRIASPQESHHLKNRITSRIASPQESHHLKNRITSRIASPQESHHLKNRITSKSLSAPFPTFQGRMIFDGSGHLIGQRHENPAWTGSWHWVRE
ncbi:hypothetical protein N7478_010605 [Penicillium angulare]|uniref:uncharacterized protein n=1 Tax=Penicillium angulare TaxID=116970 RepID=UPI002541D401|nr:uncharacterized protein N7478_010605 [Penicillium angulare]KAJ5267797.1 hypothetical protein N7478_010605 [Penicillium angulare]